MTFRIFTLVALTFIHTFRFIACGKTPLLKIDGKVLIGGLVAVHDAGGNNNLLCSSNISMFGIMRVEAMRYAIDKINKDPDLPFSNGMKLGIEIRDSCGSETTALDESLQFVKTDELSCKSQTKKPFFGVVGDGSSVPTASAARLLTLFKIPLITYGATSTELSDQSKYSFLLRTVPDDSYLSLAMLDFIETLKWTSVYMLYSSGSYGEFGYISFKTAISTRKSSLCIIDKKKILPGDTVSDMKTIISKFKNDNPEITGIVCYCETPDAKKIIQAINETNLTNHYQIIGSSMIPWYQIKTNNTISFSLYRKDRSMENDFYENWYSSLTPDNYTFNDTNQHTYFNVFTQFWKHACQKYAFRTKTNLSCNDYKSFKFCLNSTIEETCQKDDLLSYIFDAVFAFGHAIRNVLNTSYSGNVTLFMNQSAAGISFFEYLKNVSFNGSTGIVRFYNVNAYYGIYYKEELKKIGMWKSSRLNISNEFGLKIKSTCQKECNICARKVFTPDRCCWNCEECKINEYVENNACTACLNDKMPNKTHNSCNSCKPLPEKDIKKNWKYTIAILCTSGFIATSITIATFLKHNSTPLVRASGREITYLILTGIMLMYLLPIFLLISFSSKMCATFKFGVGVCLSLCHASLFIKTTRINTMFSGRRDLLFIIPHWQLVLTFFFIIPQICISYIGLRKNKYDFTRENDNRVLKCYSESEDFYATVAYNLFLMFLTAYQTFKNRKVCSNFNESRYIGFVIYTSIVVWLTFLPFFLSSSAELQTISAILDTIIVATTFLVGLYGAKMYILFFRPNKNNKVFFSNISESSNVTIVNEAVN